MKILTVRPSTNHYNVSSQHLAWLKCACCHFLSSLTILNFFTIFAFAENHEQAVSDFKECLRIQKEHLDADDRLLAETSYQLGVAYSYNRQYPEAREYLRAAMKVVDDRKGECRELFDCGRLWMHAPNRRPSIFHGSRSSSICICISISPQIRFFAMYDKSSCCFAAKLQKVIDDCGDDKEKGEFLTR